MSEAIRQLCKLIDQAGMRVTFDCGRNITHACTFCNETDRPRTLERVGRYDNGDDLVRPVCDDCRPTIMALRRAEGE